MSDSLQTTAGGADAIRRSTARLGAVQALYQMESAGIGVDAVILEFTAHRLGKEIEGVLIADADHKFFEDLLRGAVEAQSRIDPYIERHLAKNWSLKRLDATARAILRAGVYELMRRPDVPARVVIDEYVEISNAFFDSEEPRFINGLLDKAARDAREDEFSLEG